MISQPISRICQYLFEYSCHISFERKLFSTYLYLRWNCFDGQYYFILVVGQGKLHTYSHDAWQYLHLICQIEAWAAQLTISPTVELTRRIKAQAFDLISTPTPIIQLIVWRPKPSSLKVPSSTRKKTCPALNKNFETFEKTEWHSYLKQWIVSYKILLSIVVHVGYDEFTRSTLTSLCQLKIRNKFWIVWINIYFKISACTIN